MRAETKGSDAPGAEGLNLNAPGGGISQDVRVDYAQGEVCPSTPFSDLVDRVMLPETGNVGVRGTLRRREGAQVWMHGAPGADGTSRWMWSWGVAPSASWGSWQKGQEGRTEP